MEKKDIILSGVALNNKLNELKEVKIDNINWEVFYLDTLTNEKWIKEYPNSEIQGGGAPILKRIEKFPWD